jgi:hypothetical protein
LENAMQRPALRSAFLLLAGFGATAQAAGLETLLNPMAMMAAPLGGGYAPSPLGGNPFGATPFGGYGSPFGGYGGNPFGANPLSALGGLGALGSLGSIAAPIGLGLINPMGMGNVTYPAMQMAPNMMSYSHYNQMANPYGGLFGGGNPYMQRGLPNPFTPPAFSPSVPTLPFSPSQGTLPALPFLPQGQAQPAYGGYGGMGGLGGLGGLGGFGGGNPFAGLAPMPTSPMQQQAPVSLPPGAFPTPYGLTPSQPSPAPVQAPMASAPASAFPFPFPFLPQAQTAPALAPATQAATPPPAAPQPAQQAAPQASPVPASAPMPMDPAVFLQIFMKPVEGAAKAAPAEAPKPELAKAGEAKPASAQAEAAKPEAAKPAAAK